MEAEHIMAACGEDSAAGVLAAEVLAAAVDSADLAAEVLEAAVPEEVGESSKSETIRPDVKIGIRSKKIRKK